MISEVEARWLDYAWAVVNCPDYHRRKCVADGAAVPGPGRTDGNDLRWPGYIGRNYVPGHSILCVGAVHREPNPEEETAHGLIASARHWLAEGRSETSDHEYLESVREQYEQNLPRWSRWNRHFRTLIVNYLGADITEIAWTNLAKCRVSIDRGATVRQAEQKLTRLCQAEFAPMADLVEKIEPVACLVSVLHGGRGGSIVDAWDGETVRPLVYSWQGQSGHDRHNTVSGARRLEEWAPEMAEAVRRRREGH